MPQFYMKCEPSGTFKIGTILKSHISKLKNVNLDDIQDIEDSDIDVKFDVESEGIMISTGELDKEEIQNMVADALDIDVDNPEDIDIEITDVLIYDGLVDPETECEYSGDEERVLIQWTELSKISIELNLPEDFNAMSLKVTVQTFEVPFDVYDIDAEEYVTVITNIEYDGEDIEFLESFVSRGYEQHCIGGDCYEKFEIE